MPLWLGMGLQESGAVSLYFWWGWSKMVFHVPKSRDPSYTRAHVTFLLLISRACSIRSRYLSAVLLGAAALLSLTHPQGFLASRKARGSLRTCFLRSHRLKDEGGRQFDMSSWCGITSRIVVSCCFPSIWIFHARNHGAMVFAQALARSNSLEKNLQNLPGADGWHQTNFRWHGQWSFHATGTAGWFPRSYGIFIKFS